MLSAASERPGHVSVGKDAGVLAGVERAGVEINGELPARGVADVWIDFTTASVTESVATTAAAHGVGLVVGTTGLGTHARAALDVASLRIPVVYAANYSVGINVMLKLIADAARALGPDYDMEIVEAHHRGKKDAPSGTALRLAEALAEASGRDWRPPPATPATATSARAARTRLASRRSAAATSSATTPCSFWATATASRSRTGRAPATPSPSAPCAPRCGWPAASPASTTCATCSASAARGERGPTFLQPLTRRAFGSPASSLRGRGAGNRIRSPRPAKRGEG